MGREIYGHPTIDARRSGRWGTCWWVRRSEKNTQQRLSCHLFYAYRTFGSHAGRMASHSPYFAQTVLRPCRPPCRYTRFRSLRRHRPSHFHPGNLCHHTVSQSPLLLLLLLVCLYIGPPVSAAVLREGRSSKLTIFSIPHILTMRSHSLYQRFCGVVSAPSIFASNTACISLTSSRPSPDLYGQRLYGGRRNS